MVSNLRRKVEEWEVVLSLDLLSYVVNLACSIRVDLGMILTMISLAQTHELDVFQPLRAQV